MSPEKLELAKVRLHWITCGQPSDRDRAGFLWAQDFGMELLTEVDALILNLHSAQQLVTDTHAALELAHKDRAEAWKEVDQDRRARLELERVRGILAKLETTITELGVRPLRTAQKLQDLVKAAKQPGYRWCHLCDCAPCLCPKKPASVPAGIEDELLAGLEAAR